MVPDVRGFPEEGGGLFARLLPVRYGVEHRFTGRTELVQGELLSGNCLQALGVQPAIGRLFTPERDPTKDPPSAGLSYEYWAARFGSDPNVVGQKIIVNNYPLMVVGVSARI
jgi:hypothetical protein